MRIGLRPALAATVVTAAIVSSTAGTAMAAAPASQGKDTNAVAKRGQVTKFAATSTFKIKLPKGDHAVLTDPGVRFLNADGKAVGGMTRLDIKDKAGHIHKVTWSLKGDRLTQKVSGVKGSTVEGVVVRPTTPGQVTTRMDWSCFMDGAGALASGVGVIASVAGAPESGGATLSAAGPLISGTASAAKGVSDHCF
ncbi:hypothetical protein CP973_08675 [Streptomyces albofaciens JCM 4342]|uniref:hypothetical protein n=1 Tax=Streptomyces albofaciens TaxID=66866 RepID=UPI00123A6A90|nr:hypothetical protein [Streptomyces albofaciens]KAA6222019.1 hypothetical protein CP973_08675 [Streptomyces albofaciens JCM 4342]